MGVDLVRQLKPVSSAVAQKWFNATHLAASARVTMAHGLYNGNDLIACAGWSKNRFSHKPGLELIRFSTALNTSVAGALGRLTRAAKNKSLGPLSTFCDRRWGTGAGYEHSGWTRTGSTKPAPWFFKDLEVSHRSVSNGFGTVVHLHLRQHD